MANELNTLGVTLQYAVEATAGQRPSTGFTTIAGVKSIPDIDPQPTALDCTPLDETEWKRYVPGLKDVGGSLGFKFNNTDEFQTAWAAIVTAYAGLTGGKKMWFAVVIPGLTKAFYFSGAPDDLGLSAIEVDNVLEVNGYITPNIIVGWDAKPTA